MRAQIVVSLMFGIAGIAAAIFAVMAERQMHRHRQPGVTYAAATLRRDGGWRRGELFTAEGLRHQARAARYGVSAAMLWLLSLIAFVILGA